MSRLLDAGRVFHDDNGNILSGGTVTFYNSGTTTLKNTYADDDLTIVNNNPLTVQSDGRLAVEVFGTGAYTVRVADVNGATIWSSDGFQNTADAVQYGGDDVVTGTSTGADVTGTLTINGVSLSEVTSDTVGAMFSGNTETGISVTYDDTDNTVDLAISDAYINSLIDTRVPAATETTAGKVELATTAEATTATSTTVAMTPANVRSKLTASVFTSSDFTITIDGGTGSATHSLGGVPNIFAGYIKCIVSNAGYAVDDEVLLTQGYGEGATVQRNGNVWANATSIGYVLTSDSTGGIVLANKTTGAPTIITPGSWRVVLRAIRF